MLSVTLYYKVARYAQYQLSDDVITTHYRKVPWERFCTKRLCLFEETFLGVPLVLFSTLNTFLVCV